MAHKSTSFPYATSRNSSGARECTAPSDPGAKFCFFGFSFVANPKSTSTKSGSELAESLNNKLLVFMSL